MSLQLLTPAPKYAKAINFSDGFDIKPIINETETDLFDIANYGDKVYISPPTESWLIDRNNNAYRNIRPPTNPDNIKYLRSPVGISYQVFDNIKDTVLIPSELSGWKISSFLPIKPKPEEVKENSNEIRNIPINLILFITVIILAIFIIIYKRNYDNNLNMYNNQAYNPV